MEGVRKKNVGQRTRYYVKGSHPAIISSEIFDKVQAEMLNRARLLRTADGNQISSGNRYSSKYLLSNLLVCGDCGEDSGVERSAGRLYGDVGQGWKKERRSVKIHLP